MKSFSSVKVHVCFLKGKSPSQSHIILDNHPVGGNETCHVGALGRSLWIMGAFGFRSITEPIDMSLYSSLTLGQSNGLGLPYTAAGIMPLHTLTAIDHAKGSVRFWDTKINKSRFPCLPSLHSSYVDRDDTHFF